MAEPASHLCPPDAPRVFPDAKSYLSRSVALPGPLTVGALIAVLAGSFAVATGHWFGYPGVAAGLLALMHGHNPTGLERISLLTGRAWYGNQAGSEPVADSECEASEPLQQAPHQLPAHDVADSRPGFNERATDRTVVPLLRKGSGARTVRQREVKLVSRARKAVVPPVEKDQTCPKCDRVAQQWSDDGYYCEECPLQFRGRSSRLARTD